MIQKILRLFVKTLIVEDKHYVLNRNNLTQPSQMQIYQKQKTFSEFFFSFLKSILNFKHLPKKRKMTLIPDIFPIVPAPKNMVI